VAEKGLGHSVVPTAAFSTHALHKLLFCDDLPEIIAGLRHSLVTVNHQPGGRPACADGLPKGGENSFGFKGIAQVPAHDLAGKQVEKHAQLVPFWANSQIGDVRHPNQIGNLELEASLKLIGRNQLTMTALGGEDFTRRTNPATQAQGFHLPGDTGSTHMRPAVLTPEIGSDQRTPRRASVETVTLPDRLAQSNAFFFPSRRLAPEPVVIPAR
jgi:hypothetical protein